jgi:hypothetical protein
MVVRKMDSSVYREIDRGVDRRPESTSPTLLLRKETLITRVDRKPDEATTINDYKY